MSSFGVLAPLDATSAAGAMLRRQVREPILVGVMLAGLGTSTAWAVPREAVLRSQPAHQTTSGAPITVALVPGSAIGELRRLCGLTWDQLARLFNVSRRSLHFWASGKPMAPSNEEHLQRLLITVRKLDRGSASANRALLLGVHGGELPIDLLAAGEYERILSMFGSGEARRHSPSELPAEVRVARTPPPPHELVGALQNRIHPKSGRLRSARVIAVLRRSK